MVHKHSAKSVELNAFMDLNQSHIGIFIWFNVCKIDHFVLQHGHEKLTNPNHDFHFVKKKKKIPIKQIFFSEFISPVLPPPVQK